VPEPVQVSATFPSIDPNTDLPPDVLTGFLPPEDGTGRSMGHVSYTILANANLATGTPLRNVALVTFDRNESIATDQVSETDPSLGASYSLATDNVGNREGTTAAQATTVADLAAVATHFQVIPSADPVIAGMPFGPPASFSRGGPGAAYAGMVSICRFCAIPLSGRASATPPETPRPGTR
jgi:hypothetical protein